MANPTRPVWTATENELLRKLYPTAATTESIVPHFPGRNVQGIRMQANRLEIKRLTAPGAWSAKDMAILRAYYPTAGAAYVAQRVGRTPDRVRGHASEHGIVFTGVRNPKRPKPEVHTVKRAPGRPYNQAVSAAPAAQVPAKAVQAKVARAKAAPKLLSVQPSKHSPATPNLAAQKNAVAAAKKAEAAQKALEAVVPAAEIQRLPYTHPARMAYMLNAKDGGAAANRAYHEAMNQLKQAA